MLPLQSRINAFEPYNLLVGRRPTQSGNVVEEIALTSVQQVEMGTARDRHVLPFRRRLHDHLGPGQAEPLDMVVCLASRCRDFAVVIAAQHAEQLAQMLASLIHERAAGHDSRSKIKSRPVPNGPLARPCESPMSALRITSSGTPYCNARLQTTAASCALMPAMLPAL